MRKSGWTIETVLDHLLALRGADSKAVEAALAAAQQAVVTAMASQEKAINVAEVTNMRWREAANEWRGAMDDRDRASAEALTRYAQRAEVDLMLAAVDARIQTIAADVKLLQASSLASVGRSAGVTALWSWMVAAIGVATAIAAVALR